MSSEPIGTQPDAASGSGHGLRVAAVQMNSHDEVPLNLEQAEQLVAEAASAGARLVVLPEGFAFLGAESARARHAERLDAGGPIMSALRAWATRFQLSLVAGGLPERAPDADRPFNSSVVVNPEGQIVAVYRKVHLFDVDLADGTSYRESAGTTAGQTPAVVPVGGFGVGLSICYDVRFPELYRAEVEQGATLLTVPAAFTLHTGRDHWHALLRARAIENQCWLIAAAQWGRHHVGGVASSRVSYGHSLIVDPWGTVVADCSDGVGVIVANITVERVEQVRTRVPCLLNRRL